MATKKRSSFGGGRRRGGGGATAGPTLNPHDAAFLRSSKDLVAAEELGAKRLTDEVSAIARRLLQSQGKTGSASYTLKSLVENTVGSTIKELQSAEDTYKKKLRKLEEDRIALEAETQRKGVEATEEALEDLAERIEDLKNDFHEELADTRDDLNKAAESAQKEAVLLNRLQGTAVGKLLENTNRKAAIATAKERKAEFLSSRKETLQTLRAQLSIAVAVGNDDLSAALAKQLDAAKKKNVALFDDLEDLVSTKIENLDSKLVRRSLEQVKEIVEGKNSRGGGGGARGSALVSNVAGKLGGLSRTLVGDGLTNLLAGAAKLTGRALVGSAGLAATGVSALRSAKFGRPIGSVGGVDLSTQGTAIRLRDDELDRRDEGTLRDIEEARDRRDEITELRKIAKSLDGIKDGAASGSSMLRALPEIISGLLGGAAITGAIRKLLGTTSEKAAKKAAQEAAEKAEKKLAQEAAEKAEKKLAQEAAEKAEKKLAQEAAEKAAKKGGQEAVEKGAQGLASKGLRGAGKTLLRAAGSAAAVGLDVYQGAKEAYTAQQAYERGETTKEQQNQGVAAGAGGAAGAIAGGIAGGTIGASAGLALGPLGSLAGRIIGAGIGGAAGYFGGRKLGETFATGTGNDKKINEQPGKSLADMRKFLDVDQGADVENLNPAIQGNLLRMGRHYWEISGGKKLRVTSGYRSNAKQRQLYNDWVARKPGAKPAAKPGSSLHEVGYAVDLNPSQVATLEKRGLLKQYGFERLNMPGEEQHIQIAGGQKAINALGDRTSLVSGDGIGAPKPQEISRAASDSGVSVPLQNAVTDKVRNTANSIYIPEPQKGQDEFGSGGLSGGSSSTGRGFRTGGPGSDAGNAQTATPPAAQPAAAPAQISTSTFPSYSYADPTFYAANIGALG